MKLSLLGIKQPVTMRYKLIVALILLILLPFSVFNFYNYIIFERILQKKISEQSQDNLFSVQKSLDDLLKIAENTLALIERDVQIETMMSSPSNYDFIERIRFFENQFSKFSISFFLFSPQIYYTLIDNYSNVYVSFSPKDKLSYDEIAEADWFTQIHSGKTPHIWESRDSNYVRTDLSNSPYFATLYARLEDSFRNNFGVARISVDYKEWFEMFAREVPSLHYYIVDRNGETLAKSTSSVDAEFELHQYANSRTTQTGNVYYTHMDKNNDRIVNYMYYPALDCYLVNTLQFSDLFREVDQVKRSFFIIYLLLTCGFLITVIVISAALTNPLQRLQKTMAGATKRRLNVELKEDWNSREILELSITFNRMIRDMNELINKLKREERQKEEVRFQVLLSQMNPHFLLNTLNTVKSLAIRQMHMETHDLCLSLGKLLETSLQMESDLIHLKVEMGLVEAFVHIQGYRHQGPIQISYSYEDQLEYSLIPKFSLQPLVENCYNHAFWNMDSHNAQIEIRAYISEKGLILEVEDNGSGITENDNDIRKRRRSVKGIGLANIRERLQLLFRDEAELEVISLTHGTLVRMTIPLLLATPYQGGDLDVESFNRGG